MMQVVDASRVSFFRRYNRIVVVAFAALLLGLTAFFAYQLREALDDELVLVQGHVERHAQLLEFVLRTSADEVEGLRMAVGDGPVAGQACRDGRQAVSGSGWQQQPQGFSLDGVSERDATGNLVGLGRLAGRDAAFYCDLGLALRVNALARSLPFKLPQAARTRFIAAAEFHLEVPWRPSAQMPFDAEVRDDPVWRRGLPAANPDRRRFWSPAYFGGSELGLLAPVAAPVYDGDRLVGVLAIDTSIDYLHRINRSFGYPEGAVAIIDGFGQVLAHPTLFADPLAVRGPARFGQAVPHSVAGDLEALMRLPEGRPLVVGDHVVMRRAFHAAPWQLVYVAPKQALQRKNRVEHGRSMAAVLVATGLLMALAYALTLHEFVGPAARLVAHVQDVSSAAVAPAQAAGPGVPAAWRPWFDAVSRAFGESLQLGSLRKEVDIAARLQQAILPRQWPTDGRFTLWGTMRPAKDIGGDFYDHFPLAGGARCGLVVADVSGKGISAGLFGMVSKTLLRAVATQRHMPPGQAAGEVNDALCAENDTMMFVTTFLADYDPASGRLAYANAGHPAPLLVRADGTLEWLPYTGGTAFGVAEGLAYREEAVTLAAGDAVVIFTDGVTEAIDAAGREFGVVRLSGLFAGGAAPAPREAVERVLQAVAAYAPQGEPFDDITCVVLRCNRVGEGA